MLFTLKIVQIRHKGTQLSPLKDRGISKPAKDMRTGRDVAWSCMVLHGVRFHEMRRCSKDAPSKNAPSKDGAQSLAFLCELLAVRIL